MRCLVGRMAQDGAVFAATQRAVTPPPDQAEAVANKFLTTTQLNNSTWTDAFFDQLDALYPYPIDETASQSGLALFDRLSLIFTDA